MHGRRLGAGARGRPRRPYPARPAAPATRGARGSSAAEGMSGRRVRRVLAKAGRPHRAVQEREGREGAGAKWRRATRRHGEELGHTVRPDVRKNIRGPSRVGSETGFGAIRLAQWQQIEFQCSSEGPVGSKTGFGAVTSRQKSASVLYGLKFRCKNNRIDSRCGILRPQALWERDKRHPQNVLTAPKPVSLPVHSAKLLRNPFYCQKGPKAIPATRIAPPYKTDSRPGRLPTRKTRRTTFPRGHKRLPQSWGAGNRSDRTREIPEPVLVVQPHLTHPSAAAQLALEGAASIFRPSVGTRFNLVTCRTIVQMRERFPKNTASKPSYNA